MNRNIKKPNGAKSEESTKIHVIYGPTDNQAEFEFKASEIRNYIASLDVDADVVQISSERNLYDCLQTLSGMTIVLDSPKLYAVYSINELVRDEKELEIVVLWIAQYHLDIISAKERESLFGQDGWVEKKLTRIVISSDAMLKELKHAAKRMRINIMKDRDAAKTDTACWMRPSEKRDFNQVNFTEVLDLIAQERNVSMSNANAYYHKLITYMSGSNWLRFYLDELLYLTHIE